MNVMGNSSPATDRTWAKKAKAECASVSTAQSRATVPRPSLFFEDRGIPACWVFDCQLATAPSTQRQSQDLRRMRSYRRALQGTVHRT